MYHICSICVSPIVCLLDVPRITARKPFALLHRCVFRVSHCDQDLHSQNTQGMLSRILFFLLRTATQYRCIVYVWWIVLCGVCNESRMCRWYAWYRRACTSYTHYCTQGWRAAARIFLFSTSDMTPSCLWHDSFICVTWRIHLLDRALPSVWCDSSMRATWVSFICRTWLVDTVAWHIHTWAMAHWYVRHNVKIPALISATQLFDTPIDNCDTPLWYVHWCASFYVLRHSIIGGTCLHSHAWCEAFVRFKWLFFTCDMTPLYVGCSHSCATGGAGSSCVGSRLISLRIRMCDVIHPYVYHHSCTCATWLIHTRKETHSYPPYDSFISMIWLIHM